MSIYYFQHDAYEDYPVVNIKKESAEAYCLWVQKRLSEKLKEFDISCRLPTKAEWTALAMGDPNVSTPYPFGYYLRNYKGLFQCNFKALGDEYINANVDKTPAIAVNVTNYGADGAIYTTPSESYYPNGYGLYNICGNVAELVQEDQAMGGSWNSYGYDVRIASAQDYNGANPTIGFRPILILKAK
jgi:formylglycine-generating enzyme required for sulfatase activity